MSEVRHKPNILAVKPGTIVTLGGQDFRINEEAADHLNEWLKAWEDGDPDIGGKAPMRVPLRVRLHRRRARGYTSRTCFEVCSALAVSAKPTRVGNSP